MSFNPFDSVIGGILGDNPVDKIFKRIIKKSRWSRREPIKGDHIRVNRGFYYHHGIYVNDNEVI
ncbi:MAG TPA: lecithin retinol acyltransferase family protein, partial [bacterium]|nr:lecithin retinol acyltransferase family protein [bacterium]